MIDVRTPPAHPAIDASPTAASVSRRTRLVTPILVLVLALLVGFAVAYLVFREPQAPSAFDGPPSVTELQLPAAGAAPSASPAAAAPAVVSEPASPRDAVRRFLEAEVARRHDVSFALLDTKSRSSRGPLAAWQNDRPNRLVPETFAILRAEPTAEGVDVSISARRAPALSPITGLVPARSEETWRVVNDGGWRVSGGRPVDVRPELPSDAAATAAGAAWLERAASCDTAGADALQLSTNLLGSPALRDGTCRSKGTWTAGNAFAVAELPDSTVFVSAYGPGVGRWARAVPVTGTGRYTIVLAPLGDEWRVMGVVPEGSPRP